MYLCSLLSSLGIFTKWNTGCFLRKTRPMWSSCTVFTHDKWPLQWAVQALVLSCDISGAPLAPFVSWFSCNSHRCSLQSLQSFLIPEQQFSAAVGWSMCTHLTHTAHISLSFDGLALRLPFWKWREKQVTCPNKNSDPHLSGAWQYSAVTNTSPHQQQKEERRKGRQVSLLVHCWHMQKKRQCPKVCISCSKYETKGYPSAFNCCNVSSPFRCLSSYLKPVLWLWIIVTLLRATQIRHSVSQAGGMVLLFMMYSVRSVPVRHTNTKTVQVFFTIVSLPGCSDQGSILSLTGRFTL